MTFIKRRDEINVFVFLLITIFSMASIVAADLSPLIAVWLGGMAMGLFISYGIHEQVDIQEKIETVEIIDQSAFVIDAVYREGLAAGDYWRCVYLLQDIDVTHYYKIGYSADPKTRIGHFDLTLPFRVRVVHLIPCKEPQRVESVLHRRFADKRVSGEWFKLDASDVDWIIQFTSA